MNIEYSARKALDVATKNPARAWMAKTGMNAASRLRQDSLLELHHEPKFQLRNTQPIFTVGSCFAREIENFLVSRAIPFVLKGHGLPAEAYASWNEAEQRGGGVARGQLSRGALNKYTVHSMTHELRRVILDETYPNEGLIELETDRWFDPQASALRNGSLEFALANRERIRIAMAEIKNAQVVFLTLGLTESWRDLETGICMNDHPGPTWLRRFQDRFCFTAYGYDAILEELVSLIGLIRDKCYADMHFIMTVSPVPLGSTFRGTDVVVSNSASKATLRAVAETISRRYDYVDYFPSYEFVVNSPRSLAWSEDQLHVQSAMVHHIMSFFLSTYYRSESAERTAAA